MIGGIIILILAWLTVAGQRSALVSNDQEISTTVQPSSSTETTPAPIITPTFATQGPTAAPPTPTSTPTPSPTPSTPTPTPTIEKKNISISVLNGSGQAGEGNKVRLRLLDAGFEIRRLAVADKNLELTTIYYQPGKSQEAALVTGALSDIEIELQEDEAQASPDDLVLVVGANILVE